MTLEDLITTVMLILGLVWITTLLVLIKLGKLKLEMWPRILGIGGGLYTFVCLMTFSILLRPISEFMDYTVTNTLWSLAIGIVGYFGGHRIVRSSQNKK